MKKTKWFPAHVLPVRKGVYEVKDTGARAGWYAYWNGHHFGYRTITPKDAYRARSYATVLPRLTCWRGLTTPEGR